MESYSLKPWPCPKEGWYQPTTNPQRIAEREKTKQFWQTQTYWCWT